MKHCYRGGEVYCWLSCVSCGIWNIEAERGCLLLRSLHWVQIINTRAFGRTGLNRTSLVQGHTRAGEVTVEAWSFYILFSLGTAWFLTNGFPFLLHTITHCWGHLEEIGVVICLLTNITGKPTTVTTIFTTRLHLKFSCRAVVSKMCHTMIKIDSILNQLLKWYTSSRILNYTVFIFVALVTERGRN
jgi:hypothetical protein